MNVDDAKATAPLPAAADGERATLPLPGADADTVPHADPTGNALPTHIGRFVVRGWLGAGAFGDVYRCHDPQLDREVAVKVAKAGSLNTPERLARFLREAKAAANLRHPHIVPLYETGADADRRYIVSAFIDGKTMEAVILENPGSDAGGGLPLSQVADLGRKLADALAYAHSQGVVHRDVKPANVLVDAHGEPHLLDFGLAARDEEGAERLTQDGQGIGTPAYMAPEQADGKGEAASDQYSLGCILYELATGRTPFAGGPVQQMFLHRTEPPPSPRSVRPDVPKDLDTLTLKCLEKEPGRRYPSCGALADDLRRFAAGEPVTVRRPGPVERLVRWAKRNKRLAGMGLLVLLTMLLGTGFSLGFGLYANDQAGVATREKSNAETKSKQLETALSSLEESTGRLSDSHKKIESQNVRYAETLSEALVRPIVLRHRMHVLWEVERESLWEMAELRSTGLEPSLIRECCETLDNTRRFNCRAEYITHSAVGLNRTRKEEAVAYIQGSLDREGLSAEAKFNLLSVLVNAGYSDSTERTAGLLEGFSVPPADRGEWAEVFVRCCLTLPPVEAADRLARALGSAVELREFTALADGLLAASAPLPPSRRQEVLTQAAGVLLDRCGREPQPHRKAYLALGAVQLCEGLPADQRQAICDAARGHLLELNHENFDSDVLVVWGRAVAAVHRHLPAEQGGDTLSALHDDITDLGTCRWLAEGIAHAGRRLPPEQATALGRKAADRLGVLLGKQTTSIGRAGVLSCLRLIFPLLPASECKDVVSRASTKVLDLWDLRELCQAAAEVARRLPASEADEFARPILDRFQAQLSGRTSPLTKNEVAQGMHTVCEHVSPPVAREYARGAVKALLDHMKQPMHESDRESLVEGVGVVSVHLPPEEASELLLRLMSPKSSEGERMRLAASLGRVCLRLPGEQVHVAVTKALRTAKGPNEFQATLVGLARCLSSLPPEEACQLLLEASGRAGSNADRRALADGLVSAVFGLTCGELERHLATLPAAGLVGGVTLCPSPVPLRPRLSLQGLVNLLKHPFCVREAQRVVLSAVEVSCDRKFADLWEFVAFAEKEHPELDLLTPPKRPEKVTPTKVDGTPK